MTQNTFEFVQPLKVEFTCNVCKDAWDPEAATKCKDCEATFCKACFDEATDKDQKCHSCDKQPATFGNVHMVVRSLATNLNVFCRFKAHGCDWRGIRSAHQGHVDVCPKKPKEFSYVDESLTPAELICPLCHTAFVDPVQPPCEHLFCRRCITDALKCSPQCPICRMDIDVSDHADHLDQHAVPAVITEMLDDLMVYCPHKEITSAPPCPWTGRRRDYVGHKAACKAGIQPTQHFTTAEATAAAATPTATGASKALPLTLIAIPEFPSYNGTLPFVMNPAGEQGVELPSAPQSPTDPKAGTKPSQPPATAGGDDASSSGSTTPTTQAVSDDEKPHSPVTPTAGGAKVPSTSTSAGHPATPHRMYVLAHIEAPELPPTHTSRTKPLHLAIALDNSGSMGGDRIDSAKASVSFIVQQCTSQDSVGLVIFNSHIATVFPIMQMDTAGKKRAQELIENIAVCGCTNLSGGIEAAINLLVDADKKTPTGASSSSAINGVLAFTDGIANEGITDIKLLCNFIQPKVHAANAVVHTFGFGTNHSAKMLQNIAEIGSGSYYYIQNTESMKEHFADCLGGLLSTVAQNIQLTITPQPGFTVSKVLSSYSSKAGENGSTVVTMRDLYSAEQRDVLVCLKMTTAQPVGTQSKVVDLSITYDSLLSGTTDTVDTHCAVLMEATTSKAAPNQKVHEQKLRLKVTQVLKQATSLANRGNYSEGRQVLIAAKGKLFPKTPSTPYETELFTDLDLVLSGMQDQHSYTTYGGKVSGSITMTHTQQRSCTIATIESTTCPTTSVSNTRSYDTSAKVAMRFSSQK